MSAAHTPGPWKVVMQYGVWNVREDPLNWDGRGYQHVASLPTEKKGSHYGEMFSANARLIAAAPELLDAVALARAQIKEDRDALAQCHTDPSGYVDKLGAAALSEYDETLSLIDAAIAKATGATP